MDAADAPGAGRDPSADGQEREPAWLERVRRMARLDLRPGTPPSNVRFVLATAAALALSLGLNALAVNVATTEYPTTRHFSHFRFDDYGTLTIVGVLFAAAGWAAIVRLSSAARWVFFRLAIVISLLLWLPDLWILVEGETSKGVATLAVMHLLVALVTYNLLVHLAPAGPPPAQADADSGADAPSLRLSERAVRRIWTTAGLLVALEIALGVVVIVAVPFRRHDALLPPRGTWIYAAHGVVGIALGVCAVGVLVLSTVAGRIGRIGAVMGAAGVGVGLVGGVFSTFQTTRLLGMGVMLVAAIVAGVGYMAPTLEAVGKAEAARAEAARADLAARGAAGAGTVGPGSEPVTDEVVSSNGHGPGSRTG